MNQQVSNRTVNETKTPLSVHSSYHQTTGESLEYPRKEIQRISLRPGLELAIENYHPKENLVANVEVEPAPIGFAFCLSGKIRGTISGRKEDITISSGQTGLWFDPCSHCTIEYLAGQPIRCVSVRIEPWLLNSFMQGQLDHIPGDFRGIMDGCNEKYYNRIATMTPYIHMIIHQILNCPYYGVIEQMYLESKAIELISYQLAQLLSAETPCKTPLVLRPDDIERIREARDILVRNMENPPFLQELAKQVGINVTKLKRGFRQVYGTSVFGYLRYHRLEEARQLLAEGKTSVTEVVFAVGYSSPSYFTRAFAKHFGINPGVYLQGTRKNTTPQIQNML